MGTGEFEKLDKARQRRGGECFTHSERVRLTSAQVRELNALAYTTGRSKSDLLRSGLSLILAAAEMSSPFRRERAVRLLDDCRLDGRRADGYKESR